METFDTSYWIWEYLKVLFGYFLVVFVWPHVVFYRHLKPKSPIYRFGFCVSVQIILINTVVLGLGLLHILNDWTMYAVFYGIPLVLIYKRLRNLKIDSASLFHIIRISRLKMLLRRAFLACSKKLKAFWLVIRPHFLEYLLIGVFTVYALLYFSWGSFQTLCYGFGDMYVHHSWIYGLVQGQPFVKGVYPEAMHCVLYTIHTLLNIRLFNIMLFFGSIQGTVFVLASYCLLRELFHWRYTPVFVMIVFLLCSTEPWRELDGMARLQWTLPLEFGLAPQMFCVLFLIRYLYGCQKTEGGKGRLILNCDLFVFMMALSATLSAHFYPLIAAFFLCLGVAVLNLKKIFSPKRFLSLCCAVLCAVLLSVTPMLAALASGIPLQGSMGWALSVMRGAAAESRGDSQDDNLDIDTPSEESEAEAEDSEADLPPASIVALPALLLLGLEDLIGVSRSRFLISLLPLILLICLASRRLVRFLPSCLREKIENNLTHQDWLNKYLLLLLMELFLLLLYIAPYLHLPELVLGVRLASTERFLLFAIFALPLDFICSLFRLWLNEPQMYALSLLCLTAICLWGSSEKFYHGYLYCELTRYRNEVCILNDIIEHYPQFQYTVVAPTDTLYHLNEYGRHEELVLFMNMTAEERYFLPTEYIFLFVEKHPLDYAQRYYFSGPSWLAKERNGQPNKVMSSEISKELFNSASSFTINFSSYTNLSTRTILESRAYYWCQRFAELYPHEMSVYYEDDDFICYYFKQETHSPYNLSIDYEPK